MNHITNDCLSVKELQCNTTLCPSLCLCREKINFMGVYFVKWCISCFKKVSLHLCAANKTSTIININN